MSGHRSSTSLALVLRSRHYQDRDRLVTLLSAENGRVTVIAKGSRALNSKRKAALQPGTVIRCAWTQHGETRLLTEALIDESISVRAVSLERLRDLSAILEILYMISLEEAAQLELFEQALALIHYVGQTVEYHRGIIRRELLAILEDQGIQVPLDDEAQSVSEILEKVVGRKLHSFEFLQVT